ncbi:alpha/beta fold hydrolase [Streptomyces sp. NBC_00358]|uniref:alpha/beta fold hydrolase n=1 Tax=Streptomyces sp. NBC_00358 TaxID=2975725 RepID=UPI003255BD5A
MIRVVVRRFPGERTACAQYPGRGKPGARASLHTDVRVLADQGPDVLAPVRGDGPLVPFGHSLGAAVAYEVVRRMPDRCRLVPVAPGHPSPSRIRLPACRSRGPDSGEADPRRPSGWRPARGAFSGRSGASRPDRRSG